MFNEKYQAVLGTRDLLSKESEVANALIRITAPLFSHLPNG
jgi:hypothetical protein